MEYITDFLAHARWEHYLAIFGIMWGAGATVLLFAGVFIYASNDCPRDAEPIDMIVAAVFWPVSLLMLLRSK